MEVMGSDLNAGLTAGQIYLGQRAWSLVVEMYVQKAAEVFLISSIFMRKFNGHDWDGTVGIDSKGTASTQLNGMRPRSDEAVECSPMMIEDPTKDIEEPALNDKFLDGPDTSVRVRSTIQMSMAAKNKDEGGSGDEDDEDDEDDDNEDDLGEEEGEEGASSEDGAEENNDPEGGDDEDDEEDEEDGNGNNENNENNESEDDEDDEDDDEEEVVEEDDDHGEGDEEDDDEGEEEDEKDEDDEDEEALHPPKKRKK